MIKVMIAEDDFLIADMLREAIAGGGYEVCGIAATVEEAIRIGERHKPDLAVIDVRLKRGGDGTEIAAKLDHKLGILYATGNCGLVLSRVVKGQACLNKPFRMSDLLTALKVVERIVATGEVLPPLPPGLLLIQ